jgi:hypothetical protein
MSSESSKATRTTLLKRGLFLIGAAVGLQAAPQAAAALTATKTAPATLKLYGRSWHAQAQGRRAGVHPARGDRLGVYGELSLKPGGKKMGEFYSAYFSHLSPFGPSSHAAAGIEVHTFNLDDGTILGQGSHWGEEGRYAVVGGTGRYSGARGSYVARQRPVELGGDGTADFVFTLAD